MFGEAAIELPYIECYEPGTKNRLAKCNDIAGFPSWQMPDGQKAPGLQSFAALADATGCELP